MVLIDSMHALRKAEIREVHSITTSCWDARHRTRHWVGVAALPRSLWAGKEKIPKIPTSALWGVLRITWMMVSGAMRDWDPRARVTEGPSASFHCPVSCRILAFFRSTCPHNGMQSQVALPPLPQHDYFQGTLVCQLPAHVCVSLAEPRGSQERVRSVIIL